MPVILFPALRGIKMNPDPKDTNFFSPASLQQVIDYIEQNLCGELTPARIAAHFFVSVSTLSSLFKAVCQMPVMEYVRNRRLTLAVEKLATSHIPMIDLANQLGYETPEAFTKAFTRFHGFPPSFIRRRFRTSRIFLPLTVQVTLEGGWTQTNLTKSDRAGQDFPSGFGYNPFINDKGEKTMENQKIEYRIHTDSMQYPKEWETLCALAEALQESRIPFKVDGKTMIFAHGLEFPLDKICLTFKRKDVETVKTFFHHDGEVRHPEDAFWYFDAAYRSMKVRCMFYGACPDADTDAFLYRNTDPVQITHPAGSAPLLLRVQSLTFYYENARQNSPHYQMVARRLGKPNPHRKTPFMEGS